MTSILEFLIDNKLASIALLILNFILVFQVVHKIEVRTNSYVKEAIGKRYKMKNVKFNNIINDSMDRLENVRSNFIKKNIYQNSVSKLKKSGYDSRFSLAVYISCRYLLPVLLALVTLIIKKDYKQALFLGLLVFLTVDIVLMSGRRNINQKFQKYIYKIYKYLNNQISSGTRVSDAIKSVYQIVEDKEIRFTLVKLSARFELTNDIDTALNEFLTNYSCQEAESLCVALKQGIDTGDNKELLSRQEEVMFNKYFNYIQAETDRCKIKSIFAAIVFCAIISIMILIPLLDDVQNSLTQIIVN